MASLTIGRLVEDDGGLQALGDAAEAADHGADTIHDLNGIGVAALLHDREVYRTLAVHADDVVLDLVRILGLTHVADRDPTLADGFDRYAIEFVDFIDQ